MCEREREREREREGHSIPATRFYEGGYLWLPWRWLRNGAVSIFIQFHFCATRRFCLCLYTWMAVPNLRCHYMVSRDCVLCLATHPALQHILSCNTSCLATHPVLQHILPCNTSCLATHPAFVQYKSYKCNSTRQQSFEEYLPSILRVYF